MLPFANLQSEGQTASVVVGGKEWILRPMTGEAGIEWAKAAIEDGRIMAKALGDFKISEGTVRALFQRGYERTAQALGITVEQAAAFNERERAAVIAAQDKLNETAVLLHYLNIDQAAFRAYLGIPAEPTA